MKNPSPTRLAPAFAAAIALFAFNASLAPAQETAPPDPFVKEKAKRAEAEGADPDTHTNVGVVVQYIDVKRERWQAWLAENSVRLDAGSLRKEVEAWIAAGDAKLAESSLVMGKSGQRSKVESVRNLIYPGLFDEDASGPPFPGHLQSRNVGTTTEVDLLVGVDGGVDITFAPERVAYAGENPPREDAGVLEGDLRFPDLVVQKATTSCQLDPQSWTLVGCERSLESPESHTTLILSRPLVHRFVEAAGNAETEQQWMLTFSWLEVTHEFLNTSLVNQADVADWIGGGLHEEARKAGATIREERSLRFRSGQRSKNESIREVIHPTEWHPAKESAFARPAAFETRNVGTTVEVDPVLSPGGGAVDLNMAPEITSFAGWDILHRVLVGGDWKPNVTMPAFYRMQPTTQLILPLGTPVLVAVMSPPDEKGWTDPSRKVLLFVKFSR